MKRKEDYYSLNTTKIERRGEIPSSIERGGGGGGVGFSSKDVVSRCGVVVCCFFSSS